MLEYFKSHTEMINKKKCLEISGGCGLISMGMSLLGAEEVVCTELGDIIEANTKKNISNNKKMNIILENLDWNSKEDINRICNSYDNFDVIIACECLYVEAPFDPFLKVLIKIGKKYKNAKIILAYKKRYVYQENCMNAIKNYFTVEEIPRKEYHSDFIDKEEYIMYTIKMK